MKIIIIYDLLLPPNNNSDARRAILGAFPRFCSSLQKSTILLHASGIFCSGTVSTTRIKFGNPKQLPGKQKTDFSETNFWTKDKSSAMCGNR